MKLLIDSADLEEIKKIYDIYPVNGVTTNPTLLSKSLTKDEGPFTLLRRIRDFIGWDAELHVQVLSTDAHAMADEAFRIREKLGHNTYIKIPTNEQGIKAIQILKKLDFKITATAIYSIMQAFLAGKAGADYAAPYVNRIDNLGTNGAETACRIHDIFKINHLPTEVLAASFKNSQQVLDIVEHGIGAVTAGPDVIRALLRNDSVDKAIDNFRNDFESIFGEGKTLKDFNE